MTIAKSLALGMNFATARARLDRDLLFKLAVLTGHKCYRCGGDLRREDFSVDHKNVWIKQPDPKAAFFDLDNVAFSHHHCNMLEMVGRRTKYSDPKEGRRIRNRRTTDKRREVYDPTVRHAYYKRTGY